MKIAIIGATGHAGRVITQEALDRGHNVTAIIRPQSETSLNTLFSTELPRITKDAMMLEKTDLSDFDVVIDAFASQHAYQHLDLATRLISEFRDNTHTRLFFIIGASVLKQANGKSSLSMTLEKYANEPWIAAPIQQAHEYSFLQWVDNVQWTIAIPQDQFVEGSKDSYQLGTNHVMTDNNGDAKVTFGNFAAAMLDEIETPAHIRQQFTVVDQ